MFRRSSPLWLFYQSTNERGDITRKSAHADLTSLLALDHFENGGKTRAYLVIPDQRRVLRGKGLMSAATDYISDLTLMNAIHLLVSSAAL